MPPALVENSVAGIIELKPEVTEDLFTNVDQPLKIVQDTAANKPFVACDYNRDGDSYRSPWSNKYFPPLADGFLPAKSRRAMEDIANTLFDVYRHLYFEGGTSSVYFFDTDAGQLDHFGACWLIHKDVETTNALKKGFWDSTHVFDVTVDKKGQFTYILTTTVMISMNLMDDKIGKVELGGLRSQQDTKTNVTVKEPLDHVATMGKMLEDMELRIRNHLEGIYMQKTREVTNGMRSATSKRDAQWAGIAQSLNQTLFK